MQKLTLPKAIIERKDILGAAETGSGKTLAFGIPIVNSILESLSNVLTFFLRIRFYYISMFQYYVISDDDHPINFLWALILTPTRELAIQVRNHLRDLCAFSNIKVGKFSYFVKLNVRSNEVYVKNLRN